MPVSTTGTCQEIGDTAGDGQDHCELVNPASTIPNEDDVKSGCPACEVGPTVLSSPEAVYSRRYFGECFALWPAWPANTGSTSPCEPRTGSRSASITR